MSRFILLAVMLFGCAPPQPKEHVHLVGYVRGVFDRRQPTFLDRGEGYRIVFESEDGKVITIMLKEQPPAWTGMHCEIDYDTVGTSDIESFKVKKLP